MRGARAKAIKRRVVAELGRGPWRDLREMKNGQIMNLGLGGVYRKAKKVYRSRP